MASTTNIFDTWKNNIQRVINEHPLQVVHWESTRRCNLGCKHCESPTEGSNVKEELTTEEVIGAFDKIKRQIGIKNLSRVLITGGEPFVRKDLIKVLSGLRDLSYKNISIQSNGIYIADHPKILDELKAYGVTGLGVAIDGLEESHDLFRGKKGSWRKAMNALEKCVEKGYNTTVSVTAHSKNLSEFPELYKTIKKINPNWFKVTPIYPLGRAVVNQEFLLSPDQTRYLMDFLMDKHIENFEKYGTSEKIMRSDMGCGGWTGMEYEGRIRPYCFHCVAGINTLTVLYDGKLTGSNISRDFVVGDVRKDNLKDVWDNNFDLFRKRDWLRVDDCKSCNEWDYCHGGPMHLRLPDGTLLNCLYQTLQGKDYRQKIKNLSGEILKCKI